MNQVRLHLGEHTGSQRRVEFTLKCQPTIVQINLDLQVLSIRVRTAPHSLLHQVQGIQVRAPSCLQMGRSQIRCLLGLRLQELWQVTYSALMTSLAQRPFATMERLSMTDCSRRSIVFSMITSWALNMHLHALWWRFHCLKSSFLMTLSEASSPDLTTV